MGRANHAVVLQVLDDPARVLQTYGIEAVHDAPLIGAPVAALHGHDTVHRTLESGADGNGKSAARGPQEQRRVSQQAPVVDQLLTQHDQGPKTIAVC